MKTSSEYLALVWNELRRKIADSSVTMLIILLVSIAIAFLIVASVMLCKEVSWGVSLGTIGIIAGLLLNGMVIYMVPVWYLSIVRSNPRYKIAAEEIDRVMLCGFLLLIPSLVQGA